MEKQKRALCWCEGIADDLAYFSDLHDEGCWRRVRDVEAFRKTCDQLVLLQRSYEFDFAMALQMARTRGTPLEMAEFFRLEGRHVDRLCDIFVKQSALAGVIVTDDEIKNSQRD